MNGAVSIVLSRSRTLCVSVSASAPGCVPNCASACDDDGDVGREEEVGVRDGVGASVDMRVRQKDGGGGGEEGKG